MICITGDTHGITDRFVQIGKTCHLTQEDTLIVAGDFGCVFGLDWRDRQKLDILEALPYTILFIDGNHECFPKLYAYPEELWHGGRVHRVAPNVLHLMRGQVFELDGQTVFTIGGGYSIDQIYRVPGRSWWPEELPSEDEYTEARANLQAHGNQVDVILSHAAPDETMELLIRTGDIQQRVSGEMKLNCFLEEVRQTVRHRRYYFGHMHIDRELWRNQIALYNAVYDFNTDCLLSRDGLS